MKPRQIRRLLQERTKSREYFTISPEHRNPVRDEWRRVLTQRKGYQDEYEIITKYGERKWVLEFGQGVFNADGKVEAKEVLGSAGALALVHCHLRY